MTMHAIEVRRLYERSEIAQQGGARNPRRCDGDIDPGRVVPDDDDLDRGGNGDDDDDADRDVDDDPDGDASWRSER